MKNIQTISCYFKWLFKLLFIAMPIIMIYTWCALPYSKQVGTHFLAVGFHLVPSSVKILAPLSVGTRVLGFVISLVPLGIQLATILLLIFLFRNFQRMALFTLENVVIIKRIGYFILAGQIIRPFYEAIISAVLTWHNPAGKRLSEISFSTTNVSIVLIAFFMILISWIMAEGHKLQEEQKYVI